MGCKRTLGEDDWRRRARRRHGLYRAVDLAPNACGGEGIVRGDLAQVEDEALAGGDHEAEGEGRREHV